MANEVELEKVSKSVFGITSRRYRQMANEEIVPPVIRGKIDFINASKMLIEYYRKLATGQGIMGLTDARLENIKLKNDLLTMEKLLKTGELIPRIEILNEFLARIAIVKQGLMSFHRALPPILYGKDAREMANILKRHTWQLIGKFSKKSGVLKIRK